jgi:hypothetical protein
MPFWLKAFSEEKNSIFFPFIISMTFTKEKWIGCHMWTKSYQRKSLKVKDNTNVHAAVRQISTPPTSWLSTSDDANEHSHLRFCNTEKCYANSVHGVGSFA